MKTTELTTPPPLTPPPGALRAPTDANNYRVKVGRWGERWYCDPLPGCAIADATDEVWPSVTTVGKANGWPWGIVANTTAKRIAQSNELAAIAAQPPEARLKRLKGIDETAGEQARNRGSNVHRVAEAHLYGAEMHLAYDAPGYDYQPIVERMFLELAPRLVAAEFVAIHRTLNGAGYGGTGDAVLDIADRLYLVDWKTRGGDSDHGAYPNEAAQIAAYAGAQYWIVDDGQGGARRIRPLELDGGLIISIKTDSYEIYPVQL
jgi:hypothetical protein